MSHQALVKEAHDRMIATFREIRDNQTWVKYHFDEKNVHQNSVVEIFELLDPNRDCVCGFTAKNKHGLAIHKGKAHRQ